MLIWKVIGCAPGMPEAKSAHSCYLLIQNRRQILFDAGEGLSSALRRSKIDPRAIGTVFISHLHADHFIGLPLFIQMNYLLQRQQRLDIFLPKEAVTGMQRLLGMCYLFEHKLGFEVEIHPITRSMVFEMSDLTVTAHPNSHLRGHLRFLGARKLANKMECYSFIIQAASKRIIYSADLGRLDDILSMLPESDLLIIDGAHIDLSVLGGIASRNRVKRILLTHLPEDFDFQAVRKKITGQGFRRLFRAKEGLEVSL